MELAGLLMVLSLVGLLGLGVAGMVSNNCVRSCCDPKPSDGATSTSLERKAPGPQ